MNLPGDLGTEYGKQATEAVVTGNDFGVKVGEAPISKVAAQFPFQLAKTPAFPMLEHTGTQQPIGSHAGAAGTGRLGVTGGEALADQGHQFLIVQQIVHGVEQIVLEQSSLLGQGKEEEPGLVVERAEHI